MRISARPITRAHVIEWEPFEERSFSILRTTNNFVYNAQFVIYKLGGRDFRIELEADEVPALELLETDADFGNLARCKRWAMEKINELQDIAVMIAIYRSASK